MGGDTVCLFTTLSRYLQSRRETRSLHVSTDTSLDQTWTWSVLLPAQDGHGLALVVAGQQSFHVVVENRQGHLGRKRSWVRARTFRWNTPVGTERRLSYLEGDFDALVEEAVDQQDGAVERHHGQEDGEEPGQADGGDDAQLLHVVVELGEELPGQVFKHALVHQSPCRDRSG